MSLFTLDGYGVYVWSAYGATAAILAWLIWSTVAANARARDALREAERDRRQ